jgi:hypothetical protein
MKQQEISQNMTHIQHSINHNTKECADYYGLPFSFSGALIYLPSTYEGKQVIVLGIQPYTVEMVIPFAYPTLHGEN